LWWNHRSRKTTKKGELTTLNNKTWIEKESGTSSELGQWKRIGSGQLIKLYSNMTSSHSKEEKWVQYQGNMTKEKKSKWSGQRKKEKLTVSQNEKKGPTAKRNSLNVLLAVRLGNMIRCKEVQTRGRNMYR